MKNKRSAIIVKELERFKVEMLEVIVIIVEEKVGEVVIMEEIMIEDEQTQRTDKGS